ncbi:hypothetical protein [Heyndrickxia oleronia]|uniref:hypothetical protein n=1 Tax=Heyndrickxia oleronia TaxID=38875 RepID=UPI003752ABB3
METIMFSGQRGNGKTLGMSIMAEYWRRKSGCTLYSNYGLVGSKPFTSFEDFFDVAVQPSSIICLDEVHNDIDARDFNTNAVKYFTHIAFYLRKMRCTLMLTSPLFENIESRIRGTTDIYIPVNKDKNYYYYPHYDWQGQKFLKTKKIAKEKAHMIGSHIFDTYAMVTPLDYPNSRDEFKALLNELKVKNEHYLESAGRKKPKGFWSTERNLSESLVFSS